MPFFSLVNDPTSLVVWCSELLTTNHKVPGSIPGSTMKIFPCRGRIPVVTMVWVVSRIRLKVETSITRSHKSVNSDWIHERDLLAGGDLTTLTANTSAHRVPSTLIAYYGRETERERERGKKHDCEKREFISLHRIDRLLSIKETVFVYSEVVTWFSYNFYLTLCSPSFISTPDNSIWDFWYTKWQGDKFLFFPEIRFFFVRNTSRKLLTEIHLNNTFTRRTRERSLLTFKEAVLFRISWSIWEKTNFTSFYCLKDKSAWRYFEEFRGPVTTTNIQLYYKHDKRFFSSPNGPERK